MRSAERGSRSSVGTAPRSVVQSSSQANIIQNPVTPKALSSVHEYLSTCSVSFSRSLSKDLGWIEDWKTVKDPRPITEKSFQIAAEKKVAIFFILMN